MSMQKVFSLELKQERETKAAWITFQMSNDGKHVYKFKVFNLTPSDNVKKWHIGKHNVIHVHLMDKCNKFILCVIVLINVACYRMKWIHFKLELDKKTSQNMFSHSRHLVWSRF